MKIDGRCSKVILFLSRLQCKDGYGGSGEECNPDPDFDAIPDDGLSCTLPNCRQVRTMQD